MYNSKKGNNLPWIGDDKQTNGELNRDCRAGYGGGLVKLMWRYGRNRCKQVERAS